MPLVYILFKYFCIINNGKVIWFLGKKIYIYGAKKKGNKSNFYENRDKDILYFFEIQ